MNNYLDLKIIYLNSFLNGYKNINNEFNKHNIKNTTRIDNIYKLNNKNKMRLFNSKKYKFNSKKYFSNIILCKILSYIKCFELFKKNNEKYLLILNDNIIFNNNIIDDITKVILNAPKKWEIIIFISDENSIKKINNKNFIKNDNSLKNPENFLLINKKFLNNFYKTYFKLNKLRIICNNLDLNNIIFNKFENIFIYTKSFFKYTNILPNIKIKFYTDKITYDQNSFIIIYSNYSLNKEQYLLEKYNGDIIDKKLILFKYKENEVNIKPWINANYKYIGYYSLKNIKSGIYLLKNKEHYHPIIIKNTEKKKITIVYPINTIQAYNSEGGKSLYGSFLNKKKSYEERAYTVGIHRPINQNLIFGFNFNFLKWLCEKEYDINFISDYELDNYSNFNFSKLLIFIGHNEYQTLKSINNINKFINDNNNILILSGNTFWWHIRYDNYKIICYKYKHLDPIKDQKLKTINLPNLVDIYSLIGLDFRYGGYGNKKNCLNNKIEDLKLTINGKKTDIPFKLNDIKNIEYNKKNIIGFNGYKILEDNYIFKNIIVKNEILHIKTAEYDGIKIKSFINNILKPNISNFYKYKVIGYDIAWRNGLTIAGFVILQKNKDSGIVINTGTTDWCSINGIGGPDGNKIKKITERMINILLEDNSEIIKKIF